LLIPLELRITRVFSKTSSACLGLCVPIIAAVIAGFKSAHEAAIFPGRVIF